jgi:demethylmenaquinone methyltransferase/2-methoxy-6-polyprenyl-1,4-benzoquinol methylase
LAERPAPGAVAGGVAHESRPPAPGARGPARVRAMFDRVARRYRLANRVITLGYDRAWRRAAIRAAALPPGGRLLDAGAGTGDLAFTALRLSPGTHVTALDFAPAMLAAGRRADRSRAVQWCRGDARCLPFRDGTFDAAVSGYLLRNVPDPLPVLREQARVVRPGGRVVCLETTPPRTGAAACLARTYLRCVMPWLGWLITGDRRAYRYLGDTTAGFRSPEALADLLRTAGLGSVTWKLYTYGVVAIHTGARTEHAMTSGRTRNQASSAASGPRTRRTEWKATV